ncbi:hypothetical protein AMS68_007208 [Peltaster fructicola]|uniref:phosphoserine transaminase n=1 Tax=Peltaster fructicola TaxID=286661 RepID=A0A6H0Y443_9PEZI|nr:hypothetical protein AMS68_007208 [Peltaster fructicola]
MPARDQVHYFGAGPAPLPTPVLEDAAKLLLSYNDSGVGITEISHRSSDATAILEHTKSSLRQLLDIPDADGPDGYEIMFLQGGGSGEFSAVVYHMVSIYVAKKLQELGGDATNADTFTKLQQEVQKLKLDYLVTGSWSLKASQEAARLVGTEHVNVVTDARKHRDGKFGVIPEASTWSTSGNDVALTYYCDNETVDGVEFQSAPALPNLVADMSSNILSRRVNVRDHVAIFAGAQKNIGTTGITIIIVKKSILPPHAKMADSTLLRKLGLPVGPVVLDWPTIAKNNSLYNTLPIFDTWIAGAVMQRLLDASVGASPRIATQEDESNSKAKLIYSVLDASPNVYQVVPDKSVRSRMNICFRVKNSDADAEKEIVKKAEALGLLGIKGHRSVGGLRISNYNAVPVAAVQKLAAFLQDYAKA